MVLETDGAKHCRRQLLRVTDQDQSLAAIEERNQAGNLNGLGRLVDDHCIELNL